MLLTPRLIQNIKRNRFHVASLFVALSFAATSSGAAEGKLQIVTSLPDIAWAVAEIGKDHVEASSLLKGTENPHYADAVPEFIRLAADADAVCFIGLELEIGWLPKVLSRSGNSKIQPGGKGYCELGKSAPVLEKPTGPVDRSMGDVHPMGNPHFYLSPTALGTAAAEIKNTLIRLDPGNAGAYTEGYSHFLKKLQQIHDRNRAKLAPLLKNVTNPIMMEYHKEFVYFADAYGFKLFESIEEKPGVPPSAGRLAEIGAAAKASGVRLALASDFDPGKTLARFSELSGIQILSVPTSSQPGSATVAFKNYGDLQDWIVNSIVQKLNVPKK